MKFKDLDKKLIIIVVISIIAIFNAIYLTYMAYTVTSPSLFGVGGVENVNYACDFNATFSCSSVFQNDFAWIFGIPFSLIALFVYPLIVIIALLGLFNKIKNHYKIILVMAIGGVFFNGYIIVNEYLISTYCFLCLVCTAIIIVNGGLSIKGIKESK
ncbi:MAG: vitamin K epoxide reductase family protein [Candidatus Gracilibacteria bacterium]|nr:vitamin K epoxide reductase family protein [Candidatus Gracilibacteria bacterium]